MDLHLPKFNNIFSHITAYSKSGWFNLLAYNTDTLIFGHLLNLGPVVCHSLFSFGHYFSVSQWTNCFIKPMFQICVCACVFMGQTCQGMETTHFKPFKHSILKEVSPGNIHWKDWCWRWNSNTLATWYKELTHWKRLWCWERLKVGGEGDNRGWDGWMTSPTRWMWVWVNSGSWWWTGRPGSLQSMGSQRVGHDWATELNW